MNLSERVTEQLAELGIEPGESVPDPEVAPFDLDWDTWESTVDFLDKRLTNIDERMGLKALIAPVGARMALMSTGMSPEEAEQTITSLITKISKTIAREWPYREASK